VGFKQGETLLTYSDTILNIMFEFIYTVDPNASLESIQKPISMLLDIEIPYEAVLGGLGEILFTTAMDWSAARRRTVGSLYLRIARQWASESSSGIGVPFGSIENSQAILEALKTMEGANLVLEKDMRALRETSAYIERTFG
jgi:hypothetical protein